MILVVCYFDGAVLTERRLLTELQQIVSTPCDSEDLIDNVLRSYLDLTVQYKGVFTLLSF